MIIYFNLHYFLLDNDQYYIVYFVYLMYAIEYKKINGHKKDMQNNIPRIPHDIPINASWYAMPEDPNYLGQWYWIENNRFHIRSNLYRTNISNVIYFI